MFVLNSYHSPPTFCPHTITYLRSNSMHSFLSCVDTCTLSQWSVFCVKISTEYVKLGLSSQSRHKINMALEGRRMLNASHLTCGVTQYRPLKADGYLIEVTTRFYCISHSIQPVATTCTSMLVNQINYYIFKSTAFFLFYSSVSKTLYIKI